MFRARSVDMGGTFSVGFGPIDAKFGMWVWDSVPHKEKWVPNSSGPSQWTWWAPPLHAKGLKGQSHFYSAYIFVCKGPKGPRSFL